MKLLNIVNYEISNGIEVTVEKGDKIYSAYLQLPNTCDSQHSFLDENDDDELLIEIASFVQEKYSGTELSILTELGTLDFYHEENDGYHVAVDKNDEDNYVFLKESNYNSYYNVFMLVQIEQDDYYNNKDLEDQLNDALNKLINDRFGVKK